MATKTKKKSTTKRAVSTKAREPSDARTQLLRAAEMLFTTRGVDNVSLREVSAAANQKNNSAVAYYFGSKVGLIDAILDRHVRDLHGQMQAMLDLVENRPDTDMRRLVEVLVLPIVRKLDDTDGGREFISISAQLSVNPTIPLLDRPAASGEGAQRLMLAMVPKTKLPPELMLVRMMQIPMLMYGSLVNYIRLGDAAPQRDLFVADLIDALTDLTTGAPHPTH